LMVQVGLLKDEDETGRSGAKGRAARQPTSHDSAMPPGYRPVAGAASGNLERRGQPARGGRGKPVRTSRPGGIPDPMASSVSAVTGRAPSGGRGQRSADPSQRPKRPTTKGFGRAAPRSEQGGGVVKDAGGAPNAASKARGAQKPRRPSGGNSAPGVSKRADDWQPSGAAAHESRLGFVKSGRR